MTYDGSHNYTWDAEGKMHSLDTATLTYDALGRMVEKAVGSTYTQIVYGPHRRAAQPLPRSARVQPFGTRTVCAFPSFLPTFVLEPSTQLPSRAPEVGIASRLEHKERLRSSVC